MQAFNAFDGVRGMLSVLREVSLDEIREQAETPPRTPSNALNACMVVLLPSHRR
jgi:hypothetical protein